jgi:rod shape-determining protein MreD
MRYVWAVPLLLFAALAQSSVLPYFPVLGVSPNLVLILVVCWTVVRGQKEATWVVLIGGVCLSLVGSQPMGVALLALTPIVLLSEVREARLAQSDFLIAVALVLVSSLVYEVVLMVALRATGETVGWADGMVRVVLPTAMVDALFTPPLYWLVWWRSMATRPRVRSYIG